jgi:hypothetical protein
MVEPPKEPLISFDIPDKEKVYEIITEMNNKYCDLDPIPTWLVKSCFTELSMMINLIITKSLTESAFPSKLKYALVKPVIKDRNESQDDLANYRPVSNTPFISKLLEKVVSTQLKTHIENNNLYGYYQSGYRKQHSCETAVLKVVNELMGMVHANGAAVLIFLDLSAAFDTIDHEMLIQKLKKDFGIQGDVLQWIESYLSKRTYRVKIKDSKSILFYLLYGVPQGSLLGPLLFILYM